MLGGGGCMYRSREMGRGGIKLRILSCIVKLAWGGVCVCVCLWAGAVSMQCWASRGHSVIGTSSLLSAHPGHLLPSVFRGGLVTCGPRGQQVSAGFYMQGPGRTANTLPFLEKTTKLFLP